MTDDDLFDGIPLAKEASDPGTRIAPKDGGGEHSCYPPLWDEELIGQEEEVVGVRHASINMIGVGRESAPQFVGIVLPKSASL